MVEDGDNNPGQLQQGVALVEERQRGLGGSIGGHNIAVVTVKEASVSRGGSHCKVGGSTKVDSQLSDLWVRIAKISHRSILRRLSPY